MTGLRARFRTSLGGFSLDVEFDAPGRGVIALYGPSGSGKTSVLRCVAGLERADGWLEVNGERWQDEVRGLFLPAHRRPLGYVFQEPSLFPHLSVRGNLEYGWKRVPRAERRVAFEQAVELLGVAPLLARSPARLSGGERQRVAIARALLTSPRLLLMDEPLSALDQASKAEILPYLERLHDELSVPVLYVSHSPDEVARLADHMVLLDKGRVRASGPITELLTRLDLPLAHADEAEAVINATVAGHDEEFHLTYVDFPGGRISVAHQPFAIGHPVRVRIHARDVSLALERPAHTSILNIFPARVLDIAEDDVQGRTNAAEGRMPGSGAGQGRTNAAEGRMPGSGAGQGGTNAARAGMPRSGYVQDERYAAGAGMPKSGYVQDERYAARAGMPKSGAPAQVMVRLDAAGAVLLARITRKSAVALELKPGASVFAQVKSVALFE